MSSSIWTACAGDSELGALRLEPWRSVESQHQVSTRRLVDTDEEQRVLEELIDAAKPPDPTAGRRHYLLATPFRYPPLGHGSRFGRRTERGIWYGAEALRPTFAEVAYYRLVFLEGTAAALGPLETELTTFRILVRTPRGVDLTLPPFAAHESAVSSPVDYAEAQALGTAMRGAGVEAFVYRSARDREGGRAVGVFDPAAFGRRQPRGFEGWRCTADRDRVEMASRGWFERTVYVYERAEFLVNGKLPVPAF
jgi:hypothetical protein